MVRTWQGKQLDDDGSTAVSTARTLLVPNTNTVFTPYPLIASIFADSFSILIPTLEFLF